MDGFKQIYKILSALERHMGEETFSIESISAGALKISYERWEQLLIMMQDEGYIRGLVVNRSIGDTFRHIVEPIHLEITIKGMEYLEDNSFMAKAKEALRMAGEFIP